MLVLRVGGNMKAKEKIEGYIDSYLGLLDYVKKYPVDNKVMELMVKMLIDAYKCIISDLSTILNDLEGLNKRND